MHENVMDTGVLKMDSNINCRDSSWEQWPFYVLPTLKKINLQLPRKKNVESLHKQIKKSILSCLRPKVLFPPNCSFFIYFYCCRNVTSSS